VASLLAFGLLWLFALSLVVLDFAGIPIPMWRSNGRWQGIGWLLLCSVMLVKDFVEYRGWSSSRFHTVQSITSPILLVALVLMGIGLMISLRGRRKSRQAESPGE
jgi:hypothetical protein